MLHKKVEIISDLLQICQMVTEKMHISVKDFRRVIHKVIFGIFVGIFVVSISIQCEESSLPKGLPDGQVVLLTGIVTRNGEPLTIESTVKQGDQIETGKGSSVEMIFAKGLIIRLGANSKAILQLKNSQIQLNTGWFATIKNANNQKLEVVTPTAMAVVRGTALFIKVESETSTYACTCNGTVHYHSGEATDEAITAKAHKALRFVKEGQKFKQKPAGLEYHNNTDIELLAKKINHPLDWTKSSN